MRRRPVGRSLGLTLRMAFVLLLVLALYGCLAAVAIALARQGRGWTIAVVVIGLAILSACVSQLRGSGGFFLRSLGLETEDAPPELVTRLERIAGLADVPAPKLVVASTPAVNAFTVGIGRRRTVVVVTTGLLDRLESHELDAVLAHEVTHVVNRDAAVMSFASVPRVLGLLLVAGPRNPDDPRHYLWFFLWQLGLPLLAVGWLLTLALSRVREFAADRGSAVITGRPESLMSALGKSMGARIPETDLRAVAPLCIVSASGRRPVLLMDHPPVQKRIAALEEIARELGDPARS